MPNAGMPQFDFSTFPTQLFWLAVTFIILYVLMKWLALPQVEAAISARRHQLDKDLAGAAAKKEEAEATLAAYEKALAEARGRAQQTLAETGERLAAEAAERQQELARRLAEQVAAAERDIAAARQRALADIRSVAGDVAGSLAEKLLGAPADAAAVAAAVDEAIAERPL